jgi:hypothetical protein
MSRNVVLMNASAPRVAGILAAALPFHALLVMAGSLGVLALLLYAGVVLPAVWSTKPARRKAAAAVLHQILAILRRG